MVNETEIEDQKFMIRPGLGESKTAEGFLRDIEMILLSGQVSKNLDQHMFARTYRSKKCSSRIDNKKLTISRCFGKPKTAEDFLRDIEMILLSGQVSKNLDQHMFARTYQSKKC